MGNMQQRTTGYKLQFTHLEMNYVIAVSGGKMSPRNKSLYSFFFNELSIGSDCFHMKSEDSYLQFGKH